MVTHIVLFRFKDPADAAEARRRLLAMREQIPGMLSLDAGLDFTKSERSYELGLVTKHVDKDALEVYRTHPVHLEVVDFIRPRAASSVAVDFEEEG